MTKRNIQSAAGGWEVTDCCTGMPLGFSAFALVESVCVCVCARAHACVCVCERESFEDREVVLEMVVWGWDGGLQLTLAADLNFSHNSHFHSATSN